jgi:predicted nucleic acid-binding protein
VSVYLDANVLVALFFPDDAFSSRAEALLRTNPEPAIVSDFAAVEFASVIARHVQAGLISPAQARSAFTDFDRWVGAAAERLQVSTEDIASAGSLLRRLDLNLRTPDAIHMAATQRVRAELATFDKAMVSAARVLTIPLASA